MYARTCMCALTNTSIYTIILPKYVAVSKLHVAILARSSRATSQTVRNFLYAKNTQNVGETGSLPHVFI